MRYAAVVRVRLDPTAEAEHRLAILGSIVVPEAKGLPGFQQASWMYDGAGTGLCSALFDSREHAEGALGTLAPTGGPEILSCEVYEVELEV